MGLFAESGFTDSQRAITIRRIAMFVAKNLRNGTRHLHRPLRSKRGTQMKNPKRPRDVSLLAKMIVDIASGESIVSAATEAKPNRKHIGGKIGGIVRAKKMAPDERKAVAKRAATARWLRNPVPEKLEH